MQTERAEGGQNEEIQGQAQAKPATFRTLVVDSSQFMVPALEKAMVAQGHLILTADSGESAMKATRQFQPDLILLDGGVEGDQTLALLGELLVEQASAAVVVVARQGSIVEAVEAMKMGALDYLERPLDAAKIALVTETQQAWFKHA